jgi:hypothetical protein
MPRLAGGPIPFIGVGLAPLSPELRKSLAALDGDAGAVVAGVDPWGPGAAAGLRNGDVLHGVNGRPLRSEQDLRNEVATRKAGDRLALDAWRDQASLAVTVTVADRVVEAGRACEAGAHAACLHLAWYYENGDRVPKDPAVASALTARGLAGAAAACGPADPDACFSAGRAYAAGPGSARDEARAAGLFDRGCRAGVARACVELGLLFEHGRGVPLNLARAASLQQKACDAGDAVGCSNLGAHYHGGRGVPKNGARAVDLLGRACEAGEAHACKNLGFIYEKGEGVPPDARRGVALYEKGCAGGSADACGLLGLALKEGRGAKKDRARARELLGRACRAGVSWSCPEVE